MMKFQWDDVKNYSPLVLAFIGDAVQTMYVRSRLVAKGPHKVNELHKECSEFVKASAQCRAVHGLMEILTDEEIQIFKKGRNAKSESVPKNADVTDYRHATGFEALLGYLYIQGKEERLLELLEKAYSIIDTKE
ncbi:MAG: ribonuclease III domain-containing protein [Bacillota bacterium]|nr:ribonuclease III domain-containing protein [Bacillota bacterium]